MNVTRQAARAGASGGTAPKRRSLRSWLVVLGILALTGVALPGTASAVVERPGGKESYAVTIGQVAPTGTTPTGKEFSRLAMYYFDPDGTVREAFWFWSWSIGYPAATIRSTSAGCDNCAIHTAGGFQAGAEVKELRGKYTTTGSKLAITWDNGSTEAWTVASPEAGIAVLSLTGSSYGANVGQGYGSNVRTTVSVPLKEMPKKYYPGRYAYNAYDVKTGKLYSGTGTSGINLSLPQWKECNDNCLSAAVEITDPNSTACTACKPGEKRAIRYYLASEGGRKNFYEHFCTCLLQGDSKCYNGGSHLKPQLQVIDDSGRFRGWVGVEAQHRVANRGTIAVHWYTDV
ncbi:hypothetical protein BS329_08540 [Amycolatopsis coloradensis]|uniref:Uncharacterized protein n=1 Tax=Amycolatopsis coloradensis TaxID=76021 RepID=A0A1R0KYZ6_9PSEU|nr:hypothetical protein [Amycolatopsis coloradensis]OLZ54560.1 hypothetical protein BS329_08540 [Amycolatopsis coloradensis]